METAQKFDDIYDLVSFRHLVVDFNNTKHEY